MNRTLTRLAMTTAGTMLAHQIAAKALRDATFLAAWPATALPVMTVATAAFTIALAPLLSRLLSRFPPVRVVSAGFALSAAAHVVELMFFDAGRWVSAVIYLHLAGVGAVLASGFWSLVAERFDPAGARASYGRIAAAGTVGGIAGSFAAERIATAFGPAAVLVMLIGLHVLCSVGVGLLRRAPALLPKTADGDAAASIRHTFRNTYVRTIALFVVLTSASSAILDFLLKAQARASFGAGPELLRFFALFYGALQVVSFLAQTRSAAGLRRLGLARAITTMPAGVGAAGLIALLLPSWPAITALRAIDAVLRNSLFRSGYELLFVPMDAGVRQRAKAFLDVVCDRAGEAAGSGIVQLVLIAGAAATTSRLLAAVMILAAASVWVGQRFGRLYVELIERQLLRYHETPQISLVSEAGWTVLQVPAVRTAARSDPAAEIVPVTPPRADPHLETLGELRSGDATRVVAALASTTLGRIHVAQVIDLLAWDEVLPAARAALERLAAAHLGMMVDALVNPATDFTIRRRVPRILGTVPSRRSLDGLMNGLDDPRFEVRYHCSRAIDRILEANSDLSVEPARMIALIERELSIPPQKWRGYRLLDHPEAETRSVAPEPLADSERFLEHVRLLLSTIVPREPLDAAVDGVRSSNPGVRGLAFEYLEQVVPAAVLDRLKVLLASTPSAAGAAARSDAPPTATGS